MIKTRYRIFAICLVLGFSAILSGKNQPGGKIIVFLEGFRSEKGKAAVSLFNSEKGFPERSDKAFSRALAPIKNRKSLVAFENVPFGKYAIIALHDENENREMDTSFFGVPREGFGVSRNAKAFFGAPSFKDASFHLTTDTLKLNIKIKYF